MEYKMNIKFLVILILPLANELTIQSVAPTNGKSNQIQPTTQSKSSTTTLQSLYNKLFTSSNSNSPSIAQKTISTTQNPMYKNTATQNNSTNTTSNSIKFSSSSNSTVNPLQQNNSSGYQAFQPTNSKTSATTSTAQSVLNNAKTTLTNLSNSMQSAAQSIKATATNSYNSLNKSIQFNKTTGEQSPLLSGMQRSDAASIPMNNQNLTTKTTTAANRDGFTKSTKKKSFNDSTMQITPETKNPLQSNNISTTQSLQLSSPATPSRTQSFLNTAKTTASRISDSIQSTTNSMQSATSSAFSKTANALQTTASRASNSLKNSIQFNKTAKQTPLLEKNQPRSDTPSQNVQTINTTSSPLHSTNNSFNIDRSNLADILLQQA